MALLTQQQFKQQRPQGSYQQYLQFIAKRGGPQMQAAAQAALRGTRPQTPAQGGTRPPGAAGGPAGGLPGSTGRFGGAAQGSLTAGGLKDYLAAGRSYEPILNDPALLQATLGLGGYSGSLDEMLQQALLGSSFGAVDRWRINQTGEGEQNPSTESSSYALDMNELQRIVGSIQRDLRLGRPAGQLAQQRGQFVPDWAPETFGQIVGSEGILDKLRQAQKDKTGLGFDLSYLASPGINLSDPTQLLFDPRSNPQSLLGATGGGAGERGFLSTLGAQEFMTQILPKLRAAFNQGAGEQNPYGGMLTLGSYNDMTGEIGGPMRAADSYKRWTAYGQPGNDMDAYDGVESGAYNPFTGAYNYAQRPGPFGLLPNQIMSGQVRPEHFFPFEPSWAPNQDLLLTLLGRGVTAGFLQDPSIWFSGPYAPYAPGQIGEDAYARLLAAAGLQGQGQ